MSKDALFLITLGGVSYKKCRNPRRLKFNYTQPVGFANPATLQAPFAGPDGNNS